MKYPLSLSFKIMAMAPQIYVRDATGEIVCYVKQKMFRLKEVVSVFRDQTRSQLFCEIKADRVIDWSAKYNFYDANGQCLSLIHI